MLFIGGSIAHGFAITDRETFAWRLQEELPAIRVVNRGAAAYGSVQTLILLEEVLAAPDPPREIYHEFIQHHEQRNIAHPDWLRMLSRYSTRGHVATPYASLDVFGNIERRPPEGYPQWPLHTHLATVAMTERFYAYYADVRERAGLLYGQLTNNVGGIATIKGFTAEDRETARIRRDSEAYRVSNRRAILLSSAFSPLIRMIIVLGFTAALVFGGYAVLEGRLAEGLYATMIFLTQRLLWPLTRLGETFDLYQRAMASTRRILDLLDTPVHILDGGGSLDRKAVRGAIRFENVGFGYHGDLPVLHDTNLEIPPGQTTAIVGPTGSGKSTVVKLLLRFYDVDEGRILLDGTDVRALNLADLRRQIGLVSQDVFLFPGTVHENIAYGKPEASRDEVEGAARVAEAHAFITRLPDGYDTIVGERGQKLSGGQRQRLSIARALLEDPPILVLDEATSSVDNETEAAIQRSLERIAHDRTVVVIAHRLSTVRRADRIYVLESGRLLEEGRHEDLVAAGGLYAALWGVQTGSAI